MKAKRYLLLLAEIITLILWGFEWLLRIVIWISTLFFFSWRIEDMWFSRLYTWIQSFRPIKERDIYPWNSMILFIPLLFLFACNNMDGNKLQRVDSGNEFRNYYVSNEIIDDHEYIVITGSQSITMHHNLNCKCLTDTTTK